MNFYKPLYKQRWGWFLSFLKGLSRNTFAVNTRCMYKVSVNGNEYEVEITEHGVSINGADKSIYLNRAANGSIQAVVPDGVHYMSLEKGDSNKSFTLRNSGNSLSIEIKDKYDLLLEKLGMDQMLSAKQTDLKAPMPGLVLEVLAKPGDTVAKGEALLVLEAMKMENVIKAPTDAVVKDVLVSPKQAVEKNAVLIAFD